MSHIENESPTHARWRVVPLFVRHLLPSQYSNRSLKRFNLIQPNLISIIYNIVHQQSPLFHHNEQIYGFNYSIIIIHAPSGGPVLN